MIEMLEIRSIKGHFGSVEVIMTNKSGCWFPLVMDSRTKDKITGKTVTLPKVVNFHTFNQAKDWLVGERG